jgi:hypothetical protein
LQRRSICSKEREQIRDFTECPHEKQRFVVATSLHKTMRATREAIHTAHQRLYDMVALGTAPPAASGALKHGEYSTEMYFQAWEVSPKFSDSTGSCHITPGFLISDCVEIVAALYRFFILIVIHTNGRFPMKPNAM